MNQTTSSRPLDAHYVGRIAALHREIYAREYGFDATFETYVAEPLAEFAARNSPRERIWIEERNGEILGCVAIVAASETTAQLRWFLVTPAARGHGLGTRLLHEAIEFARQSGYREIILWTVSALTSAARLYRAAGFILAERRTGNCWGVEVTEEKHVLRFAKSTASEKLGRARRWLLLATIASFALSILSCCVLP